MCVCVCVCVCVRENYREGTVISVCYIVLVFLPGWEEWNESTSFEEGEEELCVHQNFNLFVTVSVY